MPIPTKFFIEKIMNKKYRSLFTKSSPGKDKDTAKKRNNQSNLKYLP